MTKPAFKSTQPPELEKQMAMIAKDVIRIVEGLQYEKVWACYLYARLAQALMQEARHEMEDTAV